MLCVRVTIPIDPFLLSFSLLLDNVRTVVAVDTAISRSLRSVMVRQPHLFVNAVHTSTGCLSKARRCITGISCCVRMPSRRARRLLAVPLRRSRGVVAPALRIVRQNAVRLTHLLKEFRFCLFNGITVSGSDRGTQSESLKRCTVSLPVTSGCSILAIRPERRRSAYTRVSRASQQHPNRSGRT